MGSHDKKYDVKIVEGIPKLQPNGPRGFYIQIQIGLFCTKLKACKLLIWSHSKQVMLHIPYDEAFCAKTVAVSQFRGCILRRTRPSKDAAFVDREGCTEDRTSVVEWDGLAYGAFPDCVTSR